MLVKYVCIVLIAFGVPLAAQRQVVPPALRISDSSAAKIVAAFRVSSSKTAAILRQVDGPQSAAKLKEISDSLVSIAIQPHPPGDLVGVDAINALRDAARPVTSEFQGVAVGGVFERLIDIYQKANSDLPKISVLKGMLVVDHVRGLSYLGQVAVSSDPIARWAMTTLGNEINPETFSYKDALPVDRNATTTFLHQLWDKISKEQPNSNSARGYPSVPNQQASSALWMIARQQGWIK